MTERNRPPAPDRLVSLLDEGDDEAVTADSSVRPRGPSATRDRSSYVVAPVPTGMDSTEARAADRPRRNQRVFDR